MVSLSRSLPSFFVCLFAAAAPAPVDLLRSLPIAFEANAGQLNSQVKFSARTADYQLFLTERAAVVNRGASTIPISLLNANRKPQIAGDDALASRSNYF